MMNFNPYNHLETVFSENSTQLGKYDDNVVFIGKKLNPDKSSEDLLHFFIGVVCEHIPSQKKYIDLMKETLQGFGKLVSQTILGSTFSIREIEKKYEDKTIQPSEIPLKLAHEKQNNGSKLSGYIDVCGGNTRMADLMTAIQATKIAAGTKLEHWIYNEFEGFKDEKISFIQVQKNIFNYPNKPQLYRSVEITSEIIEVSGEKYDRQKNLVLDWLFYDGQKFVLTGELKDGGELDTKNSDANIREVKLVNRVVKYYFNFNGSNKIETKVVSKLIAFSKDVITSSDIKVQDAEDFLMIGKDFCSLIGVSFTKIIEIRKQYHQPNEEYCLNEMEIILKEAGRIP
jgi:hypothetical protein